MPRAKFMQTILLNLFALCIGAAVTLLEVYTITRARAHTSARPSNAYNSSASAVAGIWLMFQIYIVNALKAKYPQLMFPTLVYSIFVMVASTYAPSFPTMAYGMNFVNMLLKAFLTGFGIGFGVNIFIMPVSSRTVVFKMMTGYIMALKGVLKVEGAYLEAFEDEKNLSALAPTSAPASASAKGQKPGSSPTHPQAAAVKGAITGLMALHGKLQGDLSFAKREIAIGKLGPDDIEAMFVHLRSIMMPVLGLSAVIDVFQRFVQPITSEDAVDGSKEGEKDRMLEDWNLIMKSVHDPLHGIIGVMDEGLMHVALTLQLVKPPKKGKAPKSAAGKPADVEAAAGADKPGTKGFAARLEAKSTEFYAGKEAALREWCDRRGIQLPEDFFERALDRSFLNQYTQEQINNIRDRRQKGQRQLYLLLYIEFLLYDTSQNILKFVRFADECVEKGKLKKTRFIFPGWKRMKKWLYSIFTTDDNDNQPGGAGYGNLNSTEGTMLFGEAFKGRKDPEHLPPVGIYEKATNYLRYIPNFLRSTESAFGFRCACATMSIAIIDFLAGTQAFFVKQRLVWALIMVAISMTPTTGSSVFSFVLRCFGTLLAMVLSFVAWYIVDGIPGGVLVFVWLFVAMGHYVILKLPKYIMVGMISVVTMVLIIGYELEVKKLGKTAAEANGQPAYPIYLLAPYRLATVVGGLLVAFFWTIFPYPISEHSVIRQDLGSAIYLLANYYSIVHETIKARIKQQAGDRQDKNSPAKRLEHAQHKVYSKQMLLLTGLRSNMEFQKWEIKIGGRVPREQYEKILNCTQKILTYMTLLSYASNTFDDVNDPEESAWTNDFRKLIQSVNLTSHEITSVLCLLSSAIINGQPLPPYLQIPQPFKLSEKLEELDHDILSVRHIAEKGYAAFAVMQVSTRMVMGDIETLVK